MAFLQLSSNNPQFSFIIKKNPGSGMVVRPVKQGRLFGYYSRENLDFNCFFKDHESEISYKKFRDEEWSYVNPSAHNAAEFVLDTISEFFAHIIKKDAEGDVEGFDNTMTVNMMAVKKKYLDIFQKYFPRVKMTSTEVCPNNFKVSFSTQHTLKELLSFVQLFAMFNVLKNRHLDDAEINKYMNQLVNIKAPFFVKYVFKVNVLKDMATFRQHKATLEANSFETIEFDFGFAAQQRIHAVEKLLGFDKPIVDFGCGEGNFVRKFYPKMGDHKYYAIDRDTTMLEAVERRMKNAPNLQLGTFLPAIDEDHDMIMSEVIEHMEKKDATQAVSDILLLDKAHLKKLIITTPNKDFNQFYFFDDDEVRHEDHHFEMGKAEFEAWVESIKGSKTARILEIGDKVNGICCTLGAILE